MQFQADLLGVDVIRPAVAETTALGAAYAAGLATGFWAEQEDLRENWVEDKRWSPKMDSAKARRVLPSVEEGGDEVVRLGGRGGPTGPGLDAWSVTSSSSAAARPASGSSATPPCGASRSVLVERVDLGQGTTGRFHGLLHSGGRYVVSDPRSATECAEENVVLRRVAAGAIEDTGGFFVTTPADDPGYADRFLAGCAEAGVPAQEITPAEALRREPRLNPGISRAFEVHDGAVDAWKLLWGNAASARAYGATILTYHWVTGVLRDGDRVVGVVARDDRGGREVRIEAGFTVNAGGVWAGELADMADCPGVTVVPGKGIMIAMNHRLVSSVVNRCDPPGDGDILVPIRTVCVIGTTDSKADTPRRPGASPGTRCRRCSTPERSSCPASARRARCMPGRAPGPCSRTSGRARRAATPAT